MDPKLKALVSRTNLDDLIQPPAPEIDLNQPVATAPPLESDPARSTVDPFQVNFATADIAGRFRDSSTGKGTKAFALVFLGCPLVLFGLGILYLAWSNPDITLFGRLFGSVVGLAMIGFWPYIIFAKRKQPRRS